MNKKKKKKRRGKFVKIYSRRICSEGTKWKGKRTIQNGKKTQDEREFGRRERKEKFLMSFKIDETKNNFDIFQGRQEGGKMFNAKIFPKEKLDIMCVLGKNRLDDV